MLDGALLFLVNLSLRTRLDRLDGIGDVGWADNRSVQATVDGFWEGMALQHNERRADLPFLSALRRCVRSLTVNSVVPLFQAVVASYGASSPDVSIVREHLADHICCFLSAATKGGAALS
jgi:hypothetical protein